MGKDYYKTLNLVKGASDDDIKKAYRKLALWVYFFIRSGPESNYNC